MVTEMGRLKLAYFIIRRSFTYVLILIAAGLALAVIWVIETLFPVPEGPELPPNHWARKK